MIWLGFKSRTTESDWPYSLLCFYDIDPCFSLHCLGCVNVTSTTILPQSGWDKRSNSISGKTLAISGEFQLYKEPFFQYGLVFRQRQLGRLSLCTHLWPLRQLDLPQAALQRRRFRRRHRHGTAHLRGRHKHVHWTFVFAAVHIRFNSPLSIHVNCRLVSGRWAASRIDADRRGALCSPSSWSYSHPRQARRWHAFSSHTHIEKPNFDIFASFFGWL